MENENLILQLAKIIVAQSEQTKTAPQAPQSEPSVKSEAVDLKNVSEKDFIEELFRRYPGLERERRQLATLANVRMSTFYASEKKLAQIGDDMSVRDAYLYLPACYSINQLYALIRDGKIPFKKKSDSRYYFSRTALDEWYSGDGYALLAPSREVGGAPVPPDELPAKDDFITPHQVLAILPVKRKRDTIYRWVTKGMPHFYMGVQLKFSAKEVREWLRKFAESELKLKL